MKHHVSLENCPDFETAVEFVYPTEKFPPELVESIEHYTNKIIQLKMAEAVRRLLLLLEKEKNPNIVLKALLHSIGLDPIERNGTMTDVANSLKISRQRFHYQVKTVSKRMSVKIQKIQNHPHNPFKNL